MVLCCKYQSQFFLAHREFIEKHNYLHNFRCFSLGNKALPFLEWGIVISRMAFHLEAKPFKNRGQIGYPKPTPLYYELTFTCLIIVCNTSDDFFVQCCHGDHYHLILKPFLRLMLLLQGSRIIMKDSRLSCCGLLMRHLI